MRKMDNGAAIRFNADTFPRSNWCRWIAGISCRFRRRAGFRRHRPSRTGGAVLSRNGRKSL